MTWRFPVALLGRFPQSGRLQRRRSSAASALVRGSLAQVIGVADKDPMFPDDPFLSGNRRIELIMLKEAAPMPSTDAFEVGRP